MRFFILILLIGISGCRSSEAAMISETDRQTLKSFWKYAEKKRLSELPVNERIPIVADFFLGLPYRSNTLNVTKKELPVINLHELDCVTFVENVLALALLDKYDENAITQFINNIVKLRYRNGEIVDYTSRLHYSTDWLYEMERLQLLEDITQKAGGIKYPVQISFMSENYIKYPVMVKDTSLITKIKVIETKINKRTYYYIPKEQISQAYAKISTGDIIIMTTNIKGLDAVHLGFAIKKGEDIYLLHASSTGKKVVITDNKLQEYMSGIKTQTGVIVARVVTPVVSSLTRK